MKADRLLSIVIYLLNHDTVSSSKLAERFEVSKRTILRDIEKISMSGIPIKSIPGVNGGYSIMEGYKLDGRLVSIEDRSAIITALEGFMSAYDNNKYTETLEKVSSMLPKQQNQHVFVDFGASGEDDLIQEKLLALDNAISDKKAVNFSYVNAHGGTSNRIVEPIALTYRWYAWYLLAYCKTKQDYRIFKLPRISKLEVTRMSFTKSHDTPANLLSQAFQNNNRKWQTLLLKCKSEIRIQIREYLSGTVQETYENGDFIYCIHTIDDERYWFAMLLSFGDKIEVLEPDEVKIRITETARNILNLYQER